MGGITKNGSRAMRGRGGLLRNGVAWLYELRTIRCRREGARIGSNTRSTPTAELSYQIFVGSADLEPEKPDGRDANGHERHVVNPPPVRVLLADDHPVVLAGVRALIAADPGLAIVGDAEDGRRAVELSRALLPDVVILDVSLPGLDGAEVARQLAALRPACRALVLSAHEERVHVKRMLEAGVAGYVVKRSAASTLCRAIHAVAAGAIYLDPAVAHYGPDREAAGAAAGDEDNALSERESAVLRLTASGHSSKMVAFLLGIGIKTAETHKARAMAKLGFHSRVDLVRFALSEGWLDPQTLK